MTSRYTYNLGPLTSYKNPYEALECFICRLGGENLPFQYSKGKHQDKLNGKTKNII